MNNQEADRLLESLITELRRGIIVLSVLAQLQTAQYGYSLVMLLEERGIPVEAGTLYPLLRRLEKQELLESSWDVDAAKPRKYYRLNDNGRLILARLRQEWYRLAGIMDNILKSEGNE